MKNRQVVTRKPTIEALEFRRVLAAEIAESISLLPDVGVSSAVSRKTFLHEHTEEELFVLRSHNSMTGTEQSMSAARSIEQLSSESRGLLGEGEGAGPNLAPSFTIGDGIVYTSFGPEDDHGESVVLQADGKILVAGHSGNDGRVVALARYNSDGTLDTSFSGDGKLTTSIGFNQDVGESVVVQADGKILVAGSSDTGTDWDIALVRYNSDGTLDTSFSGDGKLTTSFGTNSFDFGKSVVVQADGKILVAGSGEGKFALVRYNSDGTLDTSFSGDGKLTTAIGLVDDDAQSVVLQADGKILVTGNSRFTVFDGTTTFGYSKFALVRYNSDGTLDTNFSGDGMVTTLIGTNSFAQEVTQQADGKILVTGYSYNGNGSSAEITVVRYNIDGTLDTSFSGDGIVTTIMAAAWPQDYGNSVVVQANGKILVAGSGNIALLRYNSDGTLDTSFSGDGMVNNTFGWGQSVVVQANGKILVAGSHSPGNGPQKLGVARYNSDGYLDKSFDLSGTSTLGGTVSYTEGMAAAVLDYDVQVVDAELSQANNFSGASLTLVRNGGASNQDMFSAIGQQYSSGGTLGSISSTSGNVVVSGYNHRNLY